MRKKLMTALAALTALCATSAFAATPPHYRLTVEVRPQTHSIRVHGLWTVAAADVTDDPNGKPGGKLFHFVVSDKWPGLHHLAIAGSPIATKCRPTENQVECTASFTSAAKPEYTFELAYESDGKALPQIRIDADQAFAGSAGDYWYPQIGYVRHETGEIKFLTPKNFTLVAPGKLVRQSQEAGQNAFFYRMDRPTKFGFVAAPFRIYKQGFCTLYLQHDEPHAAKMADDCARTAAALTRIWGPFPGQGVKLVEVAFNGILLGVSEDGYILADSSQVRGEYDLFYWAHEFSHQWWGNLVRAKWPSPGGSLLTEAMAEFGALSASREIGGKDGEARYMSDHQSHPANGAPFVSYMKVLSRHDDLAPTARPEGADGTKLHYIMTSKGVLTINMLANEVGRDRFRQICIEFLKSHAGQTATWAEFEAFVEQRAAKKLGWFYAQWFDRTGLPQLYSTWKKQGDGIDITLHQCGAPYRLDHFPFAVRSETSEGALISLDVFADIRGTTSTFHVKTKDDVYKVTPDQDRTFLWLPGLCN